jgi:beta-mannosidase
MDFSSLISDDNMRQVVFIAELWQGNQLVARQSAFFAPIKHLSLANPGIEAQLSEDKGQLFIDLTSRSLALLVEVALPESDAIFSDNYICLPAGRTTRISCPMPAGWSLERAQKELRIRSVYDSYSH